MILLVGGLCINMHCDTERAITYYNTYILLLPTGRDILSRKLRSTYCLARCGVDTRHSQPRDKTRERGVAVSRSARFVYMCLSLLSS